MCGRDNGETMCNRGKQGQKNTRSMGTNTEEDTGIMEMKYCVQYRHDGNKHNTKCLKQTSWHTYVLTLCL